MVIGGLQKLTLSDFPGRIAAIVFTRGCNFRCAYCHNPELVDPAMYADEVEQDEVFRYLTARKNVLEGVVVTGGEPTLHDDLSEFLLAVRALGLAAKIDTNGSRPDRLRDILTAGLVDYVALDIKAPFESYQRIAGVSVDPILIAESLQLVLSCGIEHEVRTTYARRLLSFEELRELAVMLRGCRHFVLQGFRPSKTLDPLMLEEPAALPGELEEARLIFESAGIPIALR